MAQRQLAGRFRAAQQMRQALLAIQRPQAVGQVDPVPGLFELIVGQPALQLAFEDFARVVGADLGQGADMNDVMHAGPQAGFDRRQLAALQQFAKAGFCRFHRRFVELAALEQVDVLARHRRKLIADA